MAETPGAGVALTVANVGMTIAGGVPRYVAGLALEQVNAQATGWVANQLDRSGWDPAMARSGGDGFVFSASVLLGASASAARGGLMTGAAPGPGQRLLPSVPGRVQSRINLMNGSQARGAGWNHVVAEHFNPAKAGKSQFTVTQSQLRDILQSPEVVRSPVVRVIESSRGPRYVREVTLEEVVVGVDVTTKAPTSTFTAMTDKRGNLITAFPGRMS